MLSICIPAYTYVDYTADAVRSIVASDADVELIVVEDFDLLPDSHPERGHVAEVRDLLSSDPRIHWVRSTQRRPIQHNWNHTVSHATRPFVKLMGADDRLTAHGLSSLLAFLSQHPEAQFIGHLGVIINEKGDVTRRMQPYVESGEVLRVPPDQAVSLKLMQVARFREPACNVYTKAIWEAVGGYADRFRFCFDVHFNIRVMSSVPSLLVSQAWCELRRHQESDGAKLPADLALDELDALMQVALELVRPMSRGKDLAQAQAQLAYRVIELAMARSDGNPLRAWQYLWHQRRRLAVSPSVWCLVFGTLLRRIRKGDVQYTLSASEARARSLVLNHERGANV